MLAFLPPYVLGPLSFALFMLNTAFWGLPLYLVIGVKLVCRTPGCQALCTRALHWLSVHWVGGNRFVTELTQDFPWYVEGLDGLKRNGSYLVVSNHVSWVDIVVLQHIFHRRIPYTRFFLKDVLKVVPVLGAACWSMDFPFMRRYSREFLDKHPELHGVDIETTRTACQRLKDVELTLINYVEGTRFSPVKCVVQGAPYRHVLKPRAGGIAVVLELMGAKFDALLDVTIIYPQGRVGFWDLFSGRIEQVVVDIKARPIPLQFIGRDHETDAEFREAFQVWLNEMWQEKDERIDHVVRTFHARRKRPACGQPAA